MTTEEIAICKRIKELRKTLGLTQIEFGEKLEIKQSYMTNIETGKRPATDKIIRIICLQSWNGKKVNEDWLRSGFGDMFINFLENEYLSYAMEIGNGGNELIRTAIVKYGRLSPEDKRIIDNALDLILKEFKKGE